MCQCASPTGKRAQRCAPIEAAVHLALPKLNAFADEHGVAGLFDRPKRAIQFHRQGWSSAAPDRRFPPQIDG